MNTKAWSPGPSVPILYVKPGASPDTPAVATPQTEDLIWQRTSDLPGNLNDATLMYGTDVVGHSNSAFI